MTRTLLITILFLCQYHLSYTQKSYTYPNTPKDSTFNIYHDTTIYDPYQWMENPEDPRLINWIEAQKKLTQKESNKQTQIWTLRRQVGSLYNDTRNELEDDFVKKSDSLKSKYLLKKKWNDGYGNPPDILYKSRGSKANFQRLVRIKEFRSNKHENVLVTKWNQSPEHDLAAIELSRNGSDWREVYFYNLVNGQQMTDTLKGIRVGGHMVWSGRGVYYNRYEEPKPGRELLDKATGQSLYYHNLGTSQSEDKLLYQNPDLSGTNLFHFFRNDSSRMIFFHNYISKGQHYKVVSQAKINQGKSFFLRNILIYPSDENITFKVDATFGDTLILSTNWSAPNKKVLMTNINELNKVTELVPEYDASLRQVNRLGKDKIACIYRKEDQFLALIYNLKGELLKNIDVPKGKKINYLSETDPDAKYTSFSISSFYHPDLSYQLSLEDLTFKPANTISVPYEPKDLETRYVKYPSKDGTEIPMYITCLKDTKLDGTNPTLIYGYGGYGHTVEPRFDRSKALFLLHGGVLAIPNIRGGGAENGEWGAEGRRLKKQNAIDDFIYAAEFLISENYTNSEKIAINGKSHGGLLVAAAATQRPELFKAVIAEAGAFDMLRFDNFTGGSVNINLREFGTPDQLDDFKNLLSYSPLHKIQPNTAYPNILLITGDMDDRVPPLHSYKFLANLQEKGSASSLYNLYITPGAGHSGALTVNDFVDVLLYKYCFLFEQLGVTF